jgi:hypothetical protein
MRALATAVVILSWSLSSCTSTARITDVYTALDGQGDRQRSQFFTDSKEIHCVTELAVSRTGVTLEVKVHQLLTYDFTTDKYVSTDRITADVETSPAAGQGIQKADVSLKPQAADGSDLTDGPFQPGHFQCDAYLDGDLEKSAIFNVDFPGSTIAPGTVCRGVYTQNKQCPRYGLTTTDPKQCRCNPTKGWECD